jgi:hypothetical protein
MKFMRHFKGEGGLGNVWSMRWVEFLAFVMITYLYYLWI